MSDRSNGPVMACSRRTAAGLLFGSSIAGLATGVAGASGDAGDDQQTLAFHCLYGNAVDYAFEASGDVTPLDHAPHLDLPDEAVSADRGSAVTDGVATGTVNGGYDVFAYEGDLVAFEVTGGDCADLELWDTGDSVDACELAAQLSDPGGSSGGDRDVISSCTTIDEPGYYVLDGDLDGGSRDVCIEIAADDVVLDGRGHAIGGGTDGGVGLRVTGDDAVVRGLDVVSWETCVQLRGDRTMLRGATVENGDRSNEDRETGIVVTGTACTIRDVDVQAGPVGVRLDSATDAVLADSAVTGLTLGIVLDGATGCVLRNNAGGSGGAEGLVMDGSDDNVLVGNELGGFGIGVWVNDSHRNVVRENSFDSSDDDALSITNCEQLVLIDNDASGGQSGISLQDVTDSVLRGNATNETEDIGVQLQGGSGNVLAQNEANRNAGAGIELADTAENVLFGNTANDNAGRFQDGGIHLVDADRNTVVRNTVCGNAGPSQIVVEGASSGNRISNNDTTC